VLDTTRLVDHREPLVDLLLAHGVGLSLPRHGALHDSVSTAMPRSLAR
jgi:hypothetical protein